MTFIVITFNNSSSLDVDVADENGDGSVDFEQV